MRLWIRADASPSVGFGHLMRMIALAERARNRGVEPHFVVGGIQAALDTAAQRGFPSSFVETQDESWLYRLKPHDYVVFDGYHFGPELMGQVRDRVAGVGAVDDNGGGPFPVDVLLNQNVTEGTQYSLPAGASLLLGPRFALIRWELLVHRRNRGEDDPRTLLVTTGGSDVAGLGRRLVKLASAQTTFDRIVMVVGPAAQLTHVDEGATPVEVIRSPSDVGAAFSRGDAAVSTAGSTAWELLAMGIPTALVQVADNQRHVGPAVAKCGAGLFVGGPSELVNRFDEVIFRLANPQDRVAFAKSALRLVDGKGADRVLDALIAEKS